MEKNERVEGKEITMMPDMVCENAEVNRGEKRLEFYCLHDLALEDTAVAMQSPDYKERFRAEYVQTKIRYEKLKAFNTKIDAAFRTMGVCPGDSADKHVKMPTHDCPADLLREQQSVMGQYLHILETRAVIEGIDLSNY